MIYFMVPVIIVFVCGIPRLTDGQVDIGGLFNMLLLTGTTSLVIWTAEQAPSSIAKDNPAIALIMTLALIVAVVVVAWLKLKYPSRS